MHNIYLKSQVLNFDMYLGSEKIVMKLYAYKMIYGIFNKNNGSYQIIITFSLAFIHFLVPINCLVQHGIYLK